MARNFPKGSQILMIGLNVPDMPKIVLEMGLVPVPVDIDFDTTAPKIEYIEKLINTNVPFLLGESTPDYLYLRSSISNR